MTLQKRILGCTDFNAFILGIGDLADSGRTTGDVCRHDPPRHGLWA
jgi:hypothetical protein